MGIVRTIAIIVLSISLIVFIALFGRLPIFRKTPIGFIYRVIWIHIPKVVSAVDQRLTGGRVSRSLYRTGDYLMNEANPVVLIFFLLLQIIGEALFIPRAWRLTSTTHHILMPLLSFFPYYSLYSCATTHSTITPTNITGSISVYPYDHTLFHPGAICQTCKLPKPARSKHCSLCKACIQKQDHHCIWINNCVGRNNYIHFLLLLLAISALLLYGATLGYGLLDKTLQNHLVPSRLTLTSATAKRWSTGKSWKEYFDLILTAVSWEWQIGAVTLLMIFSFPLSTGFLVYHIYLIWAGMTTNESAKWADWRDDVADGLVFKAKVADLRDDYPRYSNDLEPEVKQWPGGEGKWWVIRTRRGVWPTRRVQGTQEHVQDQRWERVHSLSELENIYDLGFWDNWTPDIVIAMPSALARLKHSRNLTLSKIFRGRCLEPEVQRAVYAKEKPEEMLACLDIFIVME